MYRSWPPILLSSMILFRYTLLLFALLTISIAAPLHPRAGVSNYYGQPPSDPYEPGWVYYIDSKYLDKWYENQRYRILPVVALNAPENGKMVVVEIANELPPDLSDEQKRPAFPYFLPYTALTFAGHGKLLMAALRKGEAARFYINFGAPRTIDITKIEQWEKGRMLSVRMEQEGFNKLSEDVEAEASRSGKVFVPVPNYRETPKQWPTIGMNDQEAEECVGWAYYAKSLNWDKDIGIVPVVVIERPRVGQVVVVEIGKSLSYLEPDQKQPASKYFKKGTGLTFGTSNFVSLATEDIWINVAKPRIIDIIHLEPPDKKNAKVAKATAQMEAEYIPHFAGLLDQALRPTTKLTLDELIDQGSHPMDLGDRK